MSDASPRPYARLGRRLREIRERTGMSERQFAATLPISSSWLRRLESGERRATTELLRVYARKYDVSYEALAIEAGYLRDTAGKATMAIPLEDADDVEWMLRLSRQTRNFLRAVLASAQDTIATDLRQTNSDLDNSPPAPEDRC